MIDTTRSPIFSRYCPARMRRPQCRNQRYREITGQCNNLGRPHWGAARSPFRRLLSSAYSDGIRLKESRYKSKGLKRIHWDVGLSLPRTSVAGRPLPTARQISSVVHQDVDRHDHSITVFLPAFGQLIVDDIVATQAVTDPVTGRLPSCCNVDRKMRHRACLPIDIPPNDPFYSQFRLNCMEFVRSSAGLREYCRLGPRITENAQSSYIDASFLYGADLVTAVRLRSFRRGLLKTNPHFRNNGLKDLLPPKTRDPDVFCVRPNPNVFCFLSGTFIIQNWP